jgi:hypothetical protein
MPNTLFFVSLHVIIQQLSPIARKQVRIHLFRPIQAVIQLLQALHPLGLHLNLQIPIQKQPISIQSMIDHEALENLGGFRFLTTLVLHEIQVNNLA